MTVQRLAELARLASIAAVAGAILGLAVGLGAQSPISIDGVGAVAEVDEDALIIEEQIGLGETIVIVVAGSYPTRELASAEAAEPAFGDMDGFYVDTSDNYRLLGYYVQLSADYIAVDCRSYGDPLKGNYPGACDSRQAETVYVSVPVRLCLEKVVPTWSCVAEETDVALEIVRQEEIQEECEQNEFCRSYGNDAVQLIGGQLAPGQWLLLTAYRTKAGAQDWLEAMRAANFPHGTAYQVVKLGGPYVGLGQEAHPDGSGPLLAPLPSPLAYQE